MRISPLPHKICHHLINLSSILSFISWSCPEDRLEVYQYKYALVLVHAIPDEGFDAVYSQVCIHREGIGVKARHAFPKISVLPRRPWNRPQPWDYIISLAVGYNYQPFSRP